MKFDAVYGNSADVTTFIGYESQTLWNILTYVTFLTTCLMCIIFTAVFLTNLIYLPPLEWRCGNRAESDLSSAVQYSTGAVISGGTALSFTGLPPPASSPKWRCYRTAPESIWCWLALWQRVLLELRCFQLLRICCTGRTTCCTTNTQQQGNRR